VRAEFCLRGPGTNRRRPSAALVFLTVLAAGAGFAAVPACEKDKGTLVLLMISREEGSPDTPMQVWLDSEVWETFESVKVTPDVIKRGYWVQANRSSVLVKLQPVMENDGGEVPVPGAEEATWTAGQQMPLEIRAHRKHGSGGSGGSSGSGGAIGSGGVTGSGGSGGAVGSGGSSGSGGDVGSGGTVGSGGSGGQMMVIPDGGAGGTAGHDAAVCPDAEPPPHIYTCEDYCQAVQRNDCASLYPQGDCLATCESFHWKTNSTKPDSRENTIECRIAWGMNACEALSATAAMYCPSTRCNVYCDALDQNCMGDIRPVSADRTACLDACRSFDRAPIDGPLIESGTGLTCYLYWAAWAGRPGANRATACSNAGPASGKCSPRP
jgi:hypothetical protein